MAEVRLTGTGPAELKILAARLRTADPELKRDLRRRFRSAAGDAADAVQRSALALPAEKYQEGLRAQVAATIRVETRITRSGITVSIVSDGRRMPPGKASLPRHMDSPKGWSHPVFPQGPRFRLRPSRAARYIGIRASKRPLVHEGNWTWVHEMSRPFWFEQPIMDRQRQLTDALQRAVNDTQAKLA